MSQRQRDYIYRRAGTQNWWLRLQFPGEPPRAFSLKTSDRAQAELRALPYIHAHKKRLWLRTNERANRYLEIETAPRLEPGEYPQPDGGTTLCIGTRVLFL